MKKSNLEKQHKSGILVWTDPDGNVHGSYFDPDNDFNSLHDSLLCYYDYLVQNADFVLSDPILDDTDRLYDALRSFTEDSDFGFLDIIENKQ